MKKMFTGIMTLVIVVSMAQGASAAKAAPKIANPAANAAAAFGAMTPAQRTKVAALNRYQLSVVDRLSRDPGTLAIMAKMNNPEAARAMANIGGSKAGANALRGKGTVGAAAERAMARRTAVAKAR